jgi:hypothetical protein
MALVTETRTATPPPTPTPTNPMIDRAEGQPPATLAWLLGQALVSAPLFP